MALSSAQKRFARAVLRGDAEKRAAHAASVNITTVHRWRRSPTWHKDVVAYQWEILTEELLPLVRKMLTRTRTAPAIGKLLELVNPLRIATGAAPTTFLELAKLAELDTTPEDSPETPPEEPPHAQTPL